jgi:DNA-binding transcriptional MerR regulator
MSHEEEYTIGELATLAGVTPRTIRYYVSIGLLPSPGQAGPGTRYGAGHLARLRLIRRLQREHLPLGEITLRLDGLDDVAVEAALTADDLAASTGPSAEPSNETGSDTWQRLMLGPAPGSALEYIDRLKERQARTPLPAHGLAEAAPADRTTRAKARMAMRLQEPEDLAAAQRSQWDRVTLSQNVELHIRRPLSRLEHKRVERLIRLGRELLEGEDTK